MFRRPRSRVKTTGSGRRALSGRRYVPMQMRQLSAESESALRFSPSSIGLEVGWHDVSFHVDFNGRLTSFSQGEGYGWE